MTMSTRKAEGLAYFIAFIACIPTANWMIGHFGTTCLAGGPCLVQRLPSCLPISMQERPPLVDNRLHEPAIDPLGFAYPDHKNADGEHGVRRVSSPMPSTRFGTR